MSVSSLNAPSSPVVDPNANHGPRVLATGYAFLILTAVTIVLRFFARLWTKVTISIDDWLALIAAAFCLVITSMIIVQVYLNYFGQHISHSDPEHIHHFFKEVYVVTLLYPLALIFSKLSLLALYQRGICKNTNAKSWPGIVAGLHCIWAVVFILMSACACVPIEGVWDKEVKSQCVNLNLFYTSNEIASMILDIAVLLIPIWVISQIQRSWTEKIFICSTFLSGLVATVISSIRLYKLVETGSHPSDDVTFTAVIGAVWVIIEINLWVFVASIPAFKPVWTKCLQSRKARTPMFSSESYPSHPWASDPYSRRRQPRFTGEDIEMQELESVSYHTSVSCSGQTLVSDSGNKPENRLSGIRVHTEVKVESESGANM